MNIYLRIKSQTLLTFELSISKDVYDFRRPDFLLAVKFDVLASKLLLLADTLSESCSQELDSGLDVVSFLDKTETADFGLVIEVVLDALWAFGIETVFTVGW